MTIARHKQVNPEEPAWYHTISRCVRRARLCGVDPETGESFEHRKLWIKNRLADLEQVFAADVAAYGIMDNHLHLVVHMDPILERLEIDSDQWCREMTGLKRRIGTAIGRAVELAAVAARRGTQRVVSALKAPVRAESATV